MSLFAELQRRKLAQWLLAYAAGAWVLLQVLSLLIAAYHWPDSLLRVGVLLAIVGFLVTTVLAWYHGDRGEQRLGRAEGLLLLSLLVLGGGLAWRTAHAPVPLAATPTSAPVPAAVTADPHSIAVLPFVDMSQTKDQEYFSDGLSEQLLNQLAQIPQLRVIARTSSFSFKGKEVDIATIAKALNVANVLEGSVRKSGNTLRITAQLIRAADSTHLWSQTYDRELTDVFKVQDEISSAIADTLEAKISGGSTIVTTVKSVNPAAYDDYLQGRAYVARRIGDNPKLAVAAFDRAIAKDPGYSQAHSGRAFALMVGSHWLPWLPYNEHNRQAVASAEEALRLDPNNAEAYMVRGLIELTQLRITASHSDLQRAYELAPGSVDVINFYGDLLSETGELRRAEALKRQAMALDPLAFVHPYNLSTILFSQGRSRESIAIAEQAIALGGGARSATNLFRLQLHSGQIDAATKSLPKICQIPDTRDECRLAKAQLLAANGRLQEAAAEAVKLEAVVGAWGGWLSSGLYACDLQDFHRAALAMQKDLDAVKPGATYSLFCRQGGAQLPEDMSVDPEWLAAWKDPRLAEFMQAYRANLAKFRSGG